MFLLDAGDNIPFELIGSNISKIATFGSTTDTAMIQIYSNDPSSNAGFLLGTSNAAFNIGQMSPGGGAAGCNLFMLNNQIGINTTAPRATLDVQGTMQVDGNVGIGTSTANYKLQVEGKIFASDTITAFSDRSMKTDIETFAFALDTVNMLRGVKYTRKDTGERQVGVIAQEVLEILPEVVTTTPQGLSVAYGNMIGVLIEAVKELSTTVETLKDEIEELRARPSLPASSLPAPKTWGNFFFGKPTTLYHNPNGC